MGNAVNKKALSPGGYSSKSCQRNMTQERRLQHNEKFIKFSLQQNTNKSNHNNTKYQGNNKITTNTRNMSAPAWKP